MKKNQNMLKNSTLKFISETVFAEWHSQRQNVALWLEDASGTLTVKNYRKMKKKIGSI